MQESGEDTETTACMATAEPNGSSEQPDEASDGEPQALTASTVGESEKDDSATSTGPTDLGLDSSNAAEMAAQEPSPSITAQAGVTSELHEVQTAVETARHEVLEREETTETSSTLPIKDGSNESSGEAEAKVQGTEETKEAEANVEAQAEADADAEEGEPEQESSSPGPEVVVYYGEDAALPINPEPAVPKTLSCLESVTAQFAPDTKVAWAQIFGSRYEDDDQIDVDTNLSLGNCAEAPIRSRNGSIAPKNSLQAKLERERRLDEQIQASQRRFRERQRRETTSSSSVKDRTRENPTRQRPESHPAAQTSAPFKLAGLSLTQSRFCTEKALDETCCFFHRLHATVLEEPGEPSSQSVHGAYVTQWELERLIQELFEPQDLTCTRSTGRRGTLVTPLGLTDDDNAMRTAGISLETQLQASWFLPFGRLPQLRSLVMKITRRHLSEDKLAAVNRELQRQTTLLPLCAKLQQLVLRFSDHIQSDPLNPWLPSKPHTAKPELRSSVARDQTFLECISVFSAAKMEETTEDDTSVLLLPLPELLAKLQPSSVVSAQRLVFFRFLIELVAVERSRAQAKPMGTVHLPETTHSKSNAPKRIASIASRRGESTVKPRKMKLSSHRVKSSSRSLHSDAATELDAMNAQPSCVPSDGDIFTPRVSSTLALQGSQQGASEADDVEKPLTIAPTQLQSEADTEMQGDQSVAPERLLQHQLEAAMQRLREVLPSINQASAHDVDPAIHTTYLAAAACQHSVHLMLENDLVLDNEMLERLEHFIHALNAIVESITQQNATAKVEDTEQHGPVGDGPRFPPAYPESTVAEEREGSETSTNHTHFPPPYVSTTPSYWTYSPSIPRPKSSIAQSVNKSPSCCGPASARYRVWPRDSPGVGDYNIQQGDKLTFQQRPSFSFGSVSGQCSAGKHKTPGDAMHGLPSRGSRGGPNPPPKPRRWKKTSLAFVPPLLRSSSKASGLDQQDHLTDDRRHAATQSDGPQLGGGSDDRDLDEIPGLKPEGDAAAAPGDDNQRGDDEHVETDVLQALRLQQRMFVDEFVQQVVSRKDDGLPLASTSDVRGPTRSKTHWTSSQLSPGMERLLRRQRRAPSRAAPRVSMAFSELRPVSSKPAASSSTGNKATKARRRAPPPSPPPRRQLDNDQHLAWAARLSELYQPREATASLSAAT